MARVNTDGGSWEGEKLKWELKALFNGKMINYWKQKLISLLAEKCGCGKFKWIGKWVFLGVKELCFVGCHEQHNYVAWIQG